MDIKKIIKKAYLDGIIEGQVIAKVNLNFDTEGMSEHYAETELKKLRLADVSGRSEQLCPECGSNDIELIVCGDLGCNNCGNIWA
jgi:hypothetical protein